MREIIACYSCKGVNDVLFLEDDQIYMDSEVYGDFVSEMHYSLDKNASEKILQAVGGKEKLAEIFSDSPMCWKLENLCNRHNVKYAQIGF